MKIAQPSDWATQPMPEKYACIPLNRELSADDRKMMRAGVIPEQMEDKWFVFFKDDVLHFHRSWTGYCIYELQFRRLDTGWLASEFTVNRDPNQYTETNDENDRKMLSFLIDVLLLRRSADFPIDDGDGEFAVLRMWSSVGRAMLDEHQGVNRPDDRDNQK